MLDKSYYDKADSIIEFYGAKQASLIPIIQDIQSEYRYLPPELLPMWQSRSESQRQKHIV